MSAQQSPAEFSWVVKALEALAQTSRLQIYRQLIVAGPTGLCPTELAEAQGVLPNSLSFHLKTLLHSGLVTQEREGRHLRYRAQVERMQSLLNFLTAECCQGQPCLTVPELRCCEPDTAPPASDALVPGSSAVNA